MQLSTSRCLTSPFQAHPSSINEQWTTRVSTSRRIKLSGKTCKQLSVTFDNYDVLILIQNYNVMPAHRINAPWINHFEDDVVWQNVREFISYYLLLYKHQWNTRWAFARKHDIFTRENNMLFSRVKISTLLWLHNKSRLSQEKTVSLKWFGISLVFI